MKKGILTFNDKDCKGCELCTSACPVDILYLDKNRMNEKGYHLISITDAEKCIGCANCAIICPDSVIKVEVNDR